MKRSSGQKAKDHARGATAKKVGAGTAGARLTDKAKAKAKDEARILSLLWVQPAPTARAGLTVRTIVDAAVRIADREGFEAVSMRRVADELQVGTMSLYTHVPGKTELTDLMVDAAKRELYRDVGEAQSQPGGYRARIHFVAERNKALYERHPWLLDVPLGRPVLGPHAALKYETELRVLDGIGLTAVEVDSIEALLTMHVQATSRARLADLRAQQASGLTEMEWWVTTVELLKRVRTGEYPVAARIGKAAGEALQPGPSAEHLYRFGLDMICEAVAALIARKKKK